MPGQVPPSPSRTYNEIFFSYNSSTYAQEQVSAWGTSCAEPQREVGSLLMKCKANQHGTSAVSISVFQVAGIYTPSLTKYMAKPSSQTDFLAFLPACLSQDSSQCFVRRDLSRHEQAELCFSLADKKTKQWMCRSRSLFYRRHFLAT